MGKAQTKVVKQPKVDKLTAQIDALVARKLIIYEGKEAATQTMQKFQTEVDDAQTAFDELVSQKMAFPTDENILKVEDARSDKNVIVLNYENAKEDLKGVPGTLAKLDEKINALKVEKKVGLPTVSWTLSLILPAGV